MDIYCFGDSITLGEYDTERGGWVDRVKTECMARFMTRGGSEDCVFNLGIGGETTQGMRARLTNELGARLDPDVRSLVTLAYGANDAAESGGSFQVPRDAYVENLAWAIEEVRRLRCDVLLLNVTPIAPAVDGVRNPHGRLRSNAAVARYNDALAELARRTTAELIDVHAAISTHEPAAMFVADGVHPNGAGHALISELVRTRITSQER